MSSSCTGSAAHGALIDCHIHLYPASHIDSLAWSAGLPKSHPLNRPYSVAEYRAAIRQSSAHERLRGFVFLETDRKSGLGEDQWKDPLDEVSLLARIANGTPIEGEGHEVADQSLVLGIVPWAPVPGGPAVLEKYMKLVKDRCSQSATQRQMQDSSTASETHTATDVFKKVKGVRYLLQDKAKGTMLQSAFVEGLKWLGRQQLSFDLGVDARSGGLHQLQEACELMTLIHSDPHAEPPTIVINHLCKPNLRLTEAQIAEGHPDFAEWQSCVRKMAAFKNTYMKLSGAFSELPPHEPGKPLAVDQIVHRMKPWVDTVFQAFGAGRIMFASDWPVCNAGGPAIETSWKQWHDIVTEILQEQQLSNEAKQMVWSGTAATAYRIN